MIAVVFIAFFSLRTNHDIPRKDFFPSQFLPSFSGPQSTSTIEHLKNPLDVPIEPNPNLF